MDEIFPDFSCEMGQKLIKKFIVILDDRFSHRTHLTLQHIKFVFLPPTSVIKPLDQNIIKEVSAITGRNWPKKL